jgi:hypothetical protein
MASQKLAKEDLSQLLVEKHQNFITEYKREYDILDRLFVLKEKKEQLRYWVDESKTNPAQHEKYQTAMNNTEQEIARLSEELKSLKETSPRSFGPSESDPKARHKWLKAQITGHEEGVSFWTNKIKEIADAKKHKKEEKGAQAHGSEVAKKVRKVVKKPKKSTKATKASKKKQPSSN